jgi:GxxExxY protein
MNADLRKPTRDPETYAIIGAAMEVHRLLGHGFLETVYQEALALELTARMVPFKREVEVPIYFNGQRLECSYRADFVCCENVVVELKAISQWTGADEAQTINELKATGLNRALLINFGTPSLEYKRLVLNLRESVKSAEEITNINLIGV